MLQNILLSTKIHERLKRIFTYELVRPLRSQQRGYSKQTIKWHTNDVK